MNETEYQPRRTQGTSFIADGSVQQGQVEERWVAFVLQNVHFNASQSESAATTRIRKHDSPPLNTSER